MNSNDTVTIRKHLRRIGASLCVVVSVGDASGLEVSSDPLTSEREAEAQARERFASRSGWPLHA